MPEAYRQLHEITTNLGKSIPRLCKTSNSPLNEGTLYMLQPATAMRTGPAAVRVAVEMVEEGLVLRGSGCSAFAPSTRSASASRAHPAARKSLQKIATGLPASPGAAVGRAAFSSEDAVEMSAKRSVSWCAKKLRPTTSTHLDVFRKES